MNTIRLAVSKFIMFVSFIMSGLSQRLCPHDPVAKTLQGVRYFECRHCALALKKVLSIKRK